MVRNLLAKAALSTPLLLYNRTTSRTTSFTQSLPTSSSFAIAPSLAAAVAPASITFTCLANDAALEETFHSLLDTPNLDIAGKLFVDCSTVHPQTTRRLSSLLARHGASFVACPVFGAPPAAEAGQLVCVLAGDPAHVERVKPYLEGVVGRAVIDLQSSDPGRAAELKLLGNSVIFQMVSAVSEGMVVAEKSGLGTEPLTKFLELVFPGPAVGYATRMVGGTYRENEEPLFAVEWARKDMRHAMDLAKSVDAKMPGVQLVDDYLQDLEKERGKKGDVAGIYGVARQKAGLPFDKHQQ